MRGRRGLLSVLAIPIAVFAFGPVGVSAPLMIEKNLFSQDRKPPSPETAAATPQKSTSAVSVKAIQLDGVMIQGNSKKALLRVKGPVPGARKGKEKSPYMSVEEGERFGDYQVVKIEAKSISLEKDGEVFVVNLFAEGKIVPPLPAPPSSASAETHQGNAANRPGFEGNAAVHTPQSAAPQPSGLQAQTGQPMPTVPFPVRPGIQPNVNAESGEQGENNSPEASPQPEETSPEQSSQ
jgi:hypothetical protein